MTGDGLTSLPVWAVLALCALVNQVLKWVTYALTRRDLALAALAQSHGLPSSPAAVLTCLLVLVSLRNGWAASETGFALVFAVIVIHDTVKLRVQASRQREVVFRLVETLGSAGELRTHVADYLDPRTHHPIHVAVGVLFGGLFALAFSGSSG
jgi:acid phosphatase family membrane protein YuiD|nr:divergent PAP2 family protein [Candidatus Krumholzibacteria bacterium]